MRKFFLMMLLAVVSNSAMAENWKYGEAKDEMKGTVSTYATNESVNTVDFGPPYNGGQHGTIRLSGNRSLFYIEKGQLICRGGPSYGSCYVLVKFDDDEPHKELMITSGNRSTTLVSLDPSFAKALRNSKQLKIQVEVYQNGSPIFTFDLSGFETQTKLDNNESNLSAPTSSSKDKAVFGVQVVDLPASIALGLHRENLKAALVLAVFPNSISDKSGIKVGDVIYEFDGKPIEKFTDLQKAVTETDVGRKVLVKLLRGEQKLSIDAQF